MVLRLMMCFFNETATTEIYTLSLHDALPIFRVPRCSPSAERRAPCAGEDGCTGAVPDPHSARPPPALVPHPDSPLTAPLSRRDRKSTRLNSSHANISYAVFCLKKKKIYQALD